MLCAHTPDRWQYRKGVFHLAENMHTEVLYINRRIQVCKLGSESITVELLEINETIMCAQVIRFETLWRFSV